MTYSHCDGLCGGLDTLVRAEGGGAKLGLGFEDLG